ncbi:MAG: imidazole glycerol phosphate synthase subunit HisF [Sedimentisphaerales bacterium]|nr:imidazole glycerol phosphate synthase subunit HisF [Sedimentisphaerales bacterium]
MYKPRIIARLDIKGPNVVKGIRYDGLRIMGKPQDLATRYYMQGADELIYIDTVASLYGRDNLTEIVQQAASEIFIPMTVGGGVRSVEDAVALLRSGADRVAVNTAAVKHPQLIKEIAAVLGSQGVVASLQIKSRSDNRWEIFVDNGREKTGIDAMDWLKQVEQLGAGEVLVTSVDRDGAGNGFEIDFIRQALQVVTIPIIAGGGAKVPADVVELISHTRCDAVAVASMLHYNRATITDIKEALTQNGIYATCH